jgi:hypothetical protein
MRVIFAPIVLILALAVSKAYSDDGVTDLLISDFQKIDIIDYPYQVSKL